MWPQACVREESNPAAITQAGIGNNTSRLPCVLKENYSRQIRNEKLHKTMNYDTKRELSSLLKGVKIRVLNVPNWHGALNEGWAGW